MELLTRIRSCAAVALGAASALAVLGGCDMLYDYRPLGAVEELVAVHAILVEGHDTAAVLVTRVDADGSSWPPVSPLAGATVRVVGGSSSIVLPPAASEAACVASEPFPIPGAQDPDLTAGCYVASVPGGIAAGARYELEVALPDGGTVQGATTIPRVPALFEPAPGAELDVGTPDASGVPEPFVARWSAVAPGRRAEIALQADAPGCVAMLRIGTDASTNFIDVTGADSAVLRTGLVACSGPAPAQMSARLVLTVYDAHYTDYADAMAGDRPVPRERAAAGVQGAAGVFGSAVRASVPVVLVRR